MTTDIINVGLGFLEGFALIISPCILPILPIVLAGSLVGSKRRPVGIVFGFVLAFSLFTVFSRYLVQYSGIDLSLIRFISYVVLFLLGVVMLSTYLTEKFAAATQRLANTGSSLSAINHSETGFWGGLGFGALIGLIWTPCAGPILAAVIVQSASQPTTFESFLIVLAFGVGAAIPMLFIALFGRSVMKNFDFFKRHAIVFRKLLGVIIIASVAYMLYGENLGGSMSSSKNTQAPTKLMDALPFPYPAPPIVGITDWINSPPLQLNQLKGKVVLIDFWTYSCINCIRTLPYIKNWYDKYHDQGLVIIGVHSPEFEFEKDLANVKNAVEKDGIKYPVALDSRYGTWQNFHNSYWPAHYLIDKNGNVVYQHFGEGDYDVTENNIRFLLGVNASSSIANFGEEISYRSETPETYLGYARMENYASPESITKDFSASYSFPASLNENNWGLQSKWIIDAEHITSDEAGASLKIHFNARKVFIVMGNKTGFPIDVKVLLNGEPVVNEKGSDVMDSSVTVKNNRLYEVIVLPHPSSDILQITASAPGLEIYTFTFGS